MFTFNTELELAICEQIDKNLVLGNISKYRIFYWKTYQIVDILSKYCVLWLHV